MGSQPRIETSRQWLVPHEWMIKPMAQTEWIMGKGVLVWLAEVFSALSSGLYLVSLFFNSWWGALLGWVGIVLFKFPLHLFYLGKPLRFWRAFPPFSKAWRTSWFARGVVFTAALVFFGAIQLVTTYLLNYDVVSGNAATGVNVVNWIVMVLAGVFMVLTGIYCGFAMSYCKSIPFWNTGLLPVLFLITSIGDGLALIMGVGMVTGGVDFYVAEWASRVTLVVCALLLLSYVINASYQSKIGELSVRELVVGRLLWVFWIGIVGAGIVLPLAMSIVSVFTAEEVARGLLVFGIVCHTVGAFSLKYGVLRVGIYRPLLPRTVAL